MANVIIWCKYLSEIGGIAIKFLIYTILIDRVFMIYEWSIRDYHHMGCIISPR